MFTAVRFTVVRIGFLVASIFVQTIALPEGIVVNKGRGIHKIVDHFNDIAVFVRVVEAGSFTSAADKLGLSQSAVSKCVSRLEARLGTRLLNRSTRKLALTEAGAALHEHGLRALKEFDEAELEIARLQMEPRGLLRVNVPMSFGVMHLAPALPKLMRRYPALIVDVHMDDRLVDLLEEGFDCAIRIKALADSALVAKRLAPCRVVTCASPDYLNAHGTPQTPDDLKQHACLIYAYRDTPSEWQFRDESGKKHSVVVSGPFHHNNGLAARHIALSGVGIFVTPTFYVGEDLRAGRLIAILPQYTPLPELSIYAVYPERRHLSPKVRTFVDFCAEQFGPQPYWD